jgi:hypothetical protein
MDMVLYKNFFKINKLKLKIKKELEATVKLEIDKKGPNGLKE